jgi:hypothetical protein
MITSLQKSLSKFDISSSLNILSEQRKPSKRRQSFVLFDFNGFLSEISSVSPSKTIFEECPKSLIRRPCWQMRLIERSITSGGYLNQSLFLPKIAWHQYNIKFPGYSAKINSFQSIAHFAAKIQSFNLAVDRSFDTLENLFITLSSIVDEFKMIQNQLSKAFGFIKEIPDIAKDNTQSSSSPSVPQSVSV